jgi:hypothetical protein
MGTRIVEVDENNFSFVFTLSDVRVVLETDGEFILQLYFLFLSEFCGERHTTLRFQEGSSVIKRIYVSCSGPGVA